MQGRRGGGWFERRAGRFACRLPGQVLCRSVGQIPCRSAGQIQCRLTVLRLPVAGSAEETAGGCPAGASCGRKRKSVKRRLGGKVVKSALPETK